MGRCTSKLYLQISVLGLAVIILLCGDWDSGLLHFAMSNQLSVPLIQKGFCLLPIHTLTVVRLVCLHVNVVSLRDLGADQGNICDHEVAVAYNKLYLGGVLTGLYGCRGRGDGSQGDLPEVIAWGPLSRK